MTTETRPGEPGFSGREADARNDLDEVRQEATQSAERKAGPLRLKTAQGVELDIKHFARIQDPTTGEWRRNEPPPLSEQERADVVTAISQAMSEGELAYPELANHMKNNPDDIWLFPEMTLMLDSQPDPIVSDFVGEALSALSTTTTDINDYNLNQRNKKTQELFWNEVGSKYEENWIKDLLLHQLAQLEPDAADRIAARAINWTDFHDMEDEEMQQQLLLNIHQWSYEENQTQEDIDKGGFWTDLAQTLDAGQEWVTRNTVDKLATGLDSLLSSPEEAARRKSLTYGEKVAYMVGAKPPEEAGEWGMWRLISGGADAWTEIGLDPINVLAGIGIAGKAARTVPLAAKATKLGRLKMAMRANLPRFFSGSTKPVRGGRYARMAYAFRAKSVDELLEQTVKNGVADEALKIIKSGNQAALQRTFPQWGRMSDEMFKTIKETVESPEEFVDVLKAGAINDLTRNAAKVDEAERVAIEAKEAALKYVDDTPMSPPDEILALGDDVVYHGTNTKGAQGMVDGGGFADGGLTTDYQKALEWAEGTVRRRGGKPVVVALKKENLYPRAQKHLTEGDTLAQYREPGTTIPKVPVELRVNIGEAAEEATKARTVGRRPRDFEELKQTLRGEELTDEVADAVPTINQPGPRDATPNLDAILRNENIPRDVRLQAARAQLQVDVINGRQSVPFILSDIPEKARKVFKWRDRFQGKGRGSAAVRRIMAKSTPGRPPDKIDLFKTRQATEELDNLMRHFGMREERIDELLNEFVTLDFGARQDWFINKVLGGIGDDLGVPAFKHQLVELFKGTRPAKFAASGTDTWVDAAGKAHRGPILASQMNPVVPIPLQEMDQVFRRAQSIGNRSKIAKAFRWNGRGLGKTNSRRAQLVQKLRTQLGDEAEEMTDEDLWAMAYSAVNPGAGLDGRGWLAGTAMPVAGSAFNTLHRFFTKMMLVGRPIQWMWRVALLEEPIRAHIYNLPSLYSNPLQYMGAAREAYHIEKAANWATKNADFAQDVYTTLTRSGNRDTIVKSLTDNGILKDIFPEGVGNMPLPQMKRAISNFIFDAVYDRTRITKLDPIKKVGWATKKRAHSVSVARNALKKRGLDPEFTFIDDTAINQKWVSGMLGEAIGDSDPRTYSWAADAMTNTEATHHGRVWGQSIIGLLDDPLARKGIVRRASILRGEPEDLADEVISSSGWEKLRHDMQLRFPDVDDELVLAERYLDEVLGPEIDHLLRPFIDDLGSAGAADILDDLANTRKIETTLYGEPIEWDLRGANYAQAQRAVGDFTAAMRNNPNAQIPKELVGSTVDPRFMSQDDVGWVERMANWTLQTFGEEATQAINRRPAWLKEYDRWYDNYRKLDVPDDIAQGLARDHANQMINYVFFNMDQAPHYARKLNQYLPFFGATYEVMSTWTYKLPVGAGGSWPIGAAEFTRKIDRLMDALVNTGIIEREEQDDGSMTHTLNLVPPDSSALSNNEIGAFFQGAGFKAVNTIDQVISTLFGLEEGLELRSQGYRLSTGHPLNIDDYGTLSFAQTALGVNPATNLGMSLAGRFIGAGRPQRIATNKGGETLGDVVGRAEVDTNDLVRYNREIFIDTEGLAQKHGFESGTDLYNALLAGKVDPFEMELPEGVALNLPDTSFWDGFVQDTFQPFGTIDNMTDFGINFLPGVMRWGLAGLALQNQPSDEFWQDTDLDGIFGGMLAEINEAQVASQVNEAFMYLEAHDLVNGKGPFERIQEKQERLEKLKADGKTEAANKLKKEVDQDTQAFLSRAQKVAAESLILRSVTGQFLPTSPGHVRKEQELINQFWGSREHADALKIGDTPAPVKPFKSVEDMENYYDQLAAWLEDPTGDRARATFRQNYPQLMAYLTPKTFYKEPVPDIESYREYQEQIESGAREPAPLQVSMWRHRSSAIQADFYNKYISKFGNDPQQAAANALNERDEWNALNDERNRAYQALEMWDDMHGSVYDNWRKENRETDNWAQDQIVDKLHTVRDNLNIVLELEDNFDVELDLQGVAGLNTALKASIAEISQAIRDYQEFSESTNNRNAYEEAINQYFQEVYVPYQEEISALYDQLPEVADSEKQAVIYERIKILKNEHANSTYFLNGNEEVPFPNPLEYSWQGKSEEDRETKVRQWLTRPLQWTDQDQTGRIIERAPHMVNYLPTRDQDFDIYREFTLTKIELDEMFEANEITRTQRNNAMKALDEELRTRLINMDRKGEVKYMDMTPYEKLELAGELPPVLGIFSDNARYINQVLEANEESAGTIAGRQIVAPLLDKVEEHFYNDPLMKETLQKLGIDLQDEDAMDQFLPWLFFDYSGER